jgi:hypothetical protein
MSRKNKVNPDRYKTAGRLSQDDLARERQAQRPTVPSEQPHRNGDPLSWMKPEDGAGKSGDALAEATEDDEAGKLDDDRSN